MAITVSGTDITFSDASTIASRLGMITGPSVSGGTGTLITLSGIPTAAKQIWVAITTMGLSGGPGMIGLIPNNGTSNMTVSGTALFFAGTFTDGATTNIAGNAMISNNVFSVSGAPYFTPNSGVFCFTYTDSPGTGVERYRITGTYLNSNSMYLPTGIGTLSSGGKITQLNFSYGAGTGFSNLTAAVYWEI